MNQLQLKERTPSYEAYATGIHNPHIHDELLEQYASSVLNFLTTTVA